MVEGLQRMEELVEGLRRMVEVVDATRCMQESVEGMLGVCCRSWKWPIVCNRGKHTLLVVRVELGARGVCCTWRRTCDVWWWEDNLSSVRCRWWKTYGTYFQSGREGGGDG